MNHMTIFSDLACKAQIDGQSRLKWPLLTNVQIDDITNCLASIGNSGSRVFGLETEFRSAKFVRAEDDKGCRSRVSDSENQFVVAD